MQLVPQCSCQAPALKRLLPWADSSTDPSKLRSLLLSPHKLLTVQLYVLGTNTSSSNIAITRDHLRQGGERYEIYGNVAEQPDYEHACEQVIAMSTGNTCRFSALPALAVPTVRAVLTKHGYQELYSSPCWEFILQGPLLELQPPGFREQLQQKLGNQYELSTLQQRDAELVNSLWVYSGPGTLDMIKQLIAGSHTSCIRTLPDGAPVSWMLETEPGMAGMLHTLGQHRRRGLATAVLLDLLHKLQQQYQHQTVQHCNQLQQKGDVMSSIQTSINGHTYLQAAYDSAGDQQRRQFTDASWPGGHVYAYVVHNNTASLALFENVGLVKAGEFWWMGFEKPAQQIVN